MSDASPPQTLDLRYPIGRFELPSSTTPSERVTWIAEIAQAPAGLRAAIAGLSAEQLEASYRDDGWTLRQVVHHLADSHINAYVRVKLALTEENPIIKAYDEARWAELEDSRATPVEISLQLFTALHKRWVTLLESLTEEDLMRTFHHPESGVIRLDQQIALYAWHGRHHIAHITAFRKRMGW